jgi:hypothetical protein
VGMIQFSLSDVIASLNAKINELQLSKEMVEKQIARGNRVEENTACVERINDSLESAMQARSSMQDSCCVSQSCDYEYYE